VWPPFAEPWRAAEFAAVLRHGLHVIARTLRNEPQGLYSA
jgi:hypothetical protein